MIDITRCLFDATARMEKAFATSRTLLDDSDVSLFASRMTDFHREVEVRSRRSLLMLVPTRFLVYRCFSLAIAAPSL